MSIPKPPRKPKTKKVKFIKSPAAHFLLANRPGTTASFPVAQANELIDAGIAE